MNNTFIMEKMRAERMGPVSFAHLKDTAPVGVSWSGVVERIKSDPVVAENTRQCREWRQRGDEAKADRYKRTSGAFSPCVHFVGGHAQQHIVAFTGYVMADIDHIPADRMSEVVEKVKGSDFTFLAYVTSSGCGLHVISPYRLEDEEATWDDVFRKCCDYYERLTGLRPDSKTKDPTRLSFYSHDPEVHYSPSAAAFSVHGLSVFERAEREVEQQQGIHYVEGSRNQFIMSVGYLLNRMGVAETEAMEWAVRRFRDYDHPEAVIRSCYNKTSEHGTLAAAPSAAKPAATQRSVGRPRAYADMTEVAAFLQGQAEFRRNTVTHDIEFRPLEGCCIPREGLIYTSDGYALLTDLEANEFYRQMGNYGLPARNVTDLWNTFRSHFSTPFDPFATYFESLPVWEPGTSDPIHDLAATIHTTAPDDLFERCLRKWLVGVVACLLTEAANDCILALVGRPGIGKTSFFQRLLPPAWQQTYFCIKHDNSFADKDSRIQLARNVLVCMEETDTLRRRDNTQLKSVTTDRYLHIRVPYDRGDSVMRHTASLCATGNDVEILTDPTGNRRWLIFEVSDMVNPYTYQLDHDSLFAEAYTLWKSDFPFYFTQEEISEMDAYRQHFEAPSVEEELLETWIRHPQPGEAYEFLNASTLITWLTGDEVGYRGRLNPVVLGKALRKLGFEKKYVGSSKGYHLVRLSRNEVDGKIHNDGQPREEELPF